MGMVMRTCYRILLLVACFILTSMPHLSAATLTRVAGLVERNYTQVPGEGALSLAEGDSIVTGTTGYAEVLGNDGYTYYLMGSTKARVKETGKRAYLFLVFGKMLVTRKAFDDLTLAAFYDEHIRFYSDLYPFHTSYPVTLSILSKVPFTEVKAKAREGHPRLSFTDTGKRYEGYLVYRGFVGLDCAWTYMTEMPFRIQCVLSDEARLLVKFSVPFKPERKRTLTKIEEEKDYSAVRSTPSAHLAKTETLRKMLTSDKKKEENVLLQNTVYSIHTEEFYAKGPFITPAAAGIITSRYGKMRSYTGRTRRYHRGLDIGWDEGTKIYAANDGYVRLARHLYTRGNCLVIDHGEGVFTSYFHLERFIARVGDFVKKGSAVAEMGSSGFSTGPHVHWETRMGNVCIDPELMVGRDLSFNPQTLTPVIARSSVIPAITRLLSVLEARVPVWCDDGGEVPRS